MHEQNASGGVQPTHKRSSAIKTNTYEIFDLNLAGSEEHSSLDA